MPTNNRFWMQNPVATNFYVTNHFNAPRNYGNGLHEGIDLKATGAHGHPVDVLAAQRGVVDHIGNYPPGYGKYVRIRHNWADGGTYVTWYAHLSQIIVKKGQFIPMGQKLGISGTTGNSTGIHLHLTLQHIGRGLNGYIVDDVVDPFPYFQMGAPSISENELQYIKDETIPDGSILEPGTHFQKSWQVRNTGTSRWDSGYELVFTDGHQMSGPDMVALPLAEQGKEVLVSVPLSAPRQAGRHQARWQARDGNGNMFPFPLTVDIVVAGDAKQNNARFVADVTVPDGTVMQPGQTFLKQWKVQNSGTTTWGSKYQLAYFDGNQMGAPDGVRVPFTRPGKEAVIAITLTAPSTAGIYRSTWRLRDKDGKFFGELYFTLIKVEHETTPITPLGNDEMSYVSDITIPDGTPVQPGQNFEKVWRVRNAGDSAWGADYELAFFSHEQMGALDSVPLPDVQPGQTADIKVELTAPETPGFYRSTWKPRNPEGEFFAYEQYAEIQVMQQVNPGDQVDNSHFVKDVTVLDGSTIKAGATFLKAWRVRNTGSTTWDPGYKLAFYKDEPMDTEEGIPLSLVAPGEEVVLSVEMTAPLNPGHYKSTWKIMNPAGGFFGHEFYTIIQVPFTIPIITDNRARFIAHETVDPYTDIDPGQDFEKIWLVRNRGRSDWSSGYSLAFLDGEQMSGPQSVAIPLVESGRTARLRVTLTAPDERGTYKGYWKLRDPSGKTFGPRLPVWIVVKSP